MSRTSGRSPAPAGGMGRASIGCRRIMSSSGATKKRERRRPAGVEKTPPAEYDRPLAGLAVRALGYPDPYAPVVGYAGGWPVGYDPESGRAWLTHCYAMVGVGR